MLTEKGLPMIGRGATRGRRMAGSLLAMLAAALLATSGAFGQIEGIVSDDESADSWAPSRCQRSTVT